MARKLVSGERLVVASHNPGKVREIGALITPYGLEAVSASTLGLAEPEETETTFIGNAALKARAAADASGLPALADDSGLEVVALGGAPGIFSARWAGPGKDFSVAMEKVMAELSARDALSDDQRAANFTCALAIAWPDGPCETFEGKVFGHLVWPMRGDKGFGYDPIFVPKGHAMTFAEMEPDAKHAMSHRANAFAQFKEACLDDDGV
ncbi:MAG: RdgB/HAM1 family non-canonical purine NTP pyrophosphatase [Pseudomonadota bacterium]